MGENNAPQDHDADLQALRAPLGAENPKRRAMSELQKRAVERDAALGRAVWAYFRQRAISSVNMARHAGRLGPACDLACHDCGEPANVYEHRDYSDPMTVEPACYRCNALRGPAVLPPEYVVARLRMVDGATLSLSMALSDLDGLCARLRESVAECKPP